MKTWVWLCKHKNGSNYAKGWQKCHGPAAPCSPDRELGLLMGPSQVEDGGEDNYCSWNSTINISSAVFVLTTPVRSLTLVSKLSCRCQLLDHGELAQTTLTLAKGYKCLHGRESRFCKQRCIGKKIIYNHHMFISIQFVLASVYMETFNIIQRLKRDDFTALFKRKDDMIVLWDNRIQFSISFKLKSQVYLRRVL